MKKRLKAVSKAMILVLVAQLAFSQPVFAKVGDMGFFGGISEGRRLPKTLELLLKESSTKKKNSKTADEFVYKEMIFLSGEPVEFEGILTVKPGTIKDKDVEAGIGTYTEDYQVSSSDTTSDDTSINRKITFDVNFRQVDNQIIRDYLVKTWNETVTTPTGTYSIDPKQSYFGISILEDIQPGVTYYKGDTSQRAVYTGDDAEDYVILETDGSFYGYSSAWSSSEVHRIDGVVTTPDWQMQYQVRPSVSMSKLLQYSANEPTIISFPGNYREVMENKSGLQYDIFMAPKHLFDMDMNGGTSIPSYNTFEQLIAPDLNFLKGHFAEDDIKKLFSMEVLEGDPKFYQPEQSITRGQFVSALVKAIKLPVDIESSSSKKSKKDDAVRMAFPDVFPENPYYPYIMAAYEAGIAIGRDIGTFHTDEPIEREEAFAILLRTLGLEQLGLDPTPVTPFTDDYKVSAWAKQELYAAERIGLISGDQDGNIRPNDYVSKAEAAALINRLIDYMRDDLQKDYNQNIVHFAN